MHRALQCYHQENIVKAVSQRLATDRIATLRLKKERERCRVISGMHVIAVRLLGKRYSGLKDVLSSAKRMLNGRGYWIATSLSFSPLPTSFIFFDCFVLRFPLLGG